MDCPKHLILKVAAVFLLLFTYEPLIAQEITPLSIEIHFKEHHFTPLKIAVPAGIPLNVKVLNDSHERIEFESFKLNREKVVEAGQSILVHVPALRPGNYDFFDDFHSDVPEGDIAAK